MKTNKYTKRTFLIVLLTIFLGGTCSAQTKEELKGIPINETGISVEEYNSIMKHQVIDLSLEDNKSFKLEIEKVNSNTEDARMTHILLHPLNGEVKVINKTSAVQKPYDPNITKENIKTIKE